MSSFKCSKYYLILLYVVPTESCGENYILCKFEYDFVIAFFNVQFYSVKNLEWYAILWFITYEFENENLERNETEAACIFKNIVYTR